MSTTEQKIIVFRIGWMKHYQGMKGDTIQSTAQFVVSEKYGYEMYNFLPHNGNMYGFVQSSGVGDFTQRTIRIERLGAARNAASVDNVLIAWVAPQMSGGVFLVGWYSDATVYRQYQEAPSGSDRTFKNIEIGYYAKAKECNSILLPEEKRTLPVPQSGNQMGGLGQSLVWYADSGKKNDNLFRQNLLDFIESYEHDSLESVLNEPEFPNQKYVEGTPRKMLSTTYERNRKARDTCLEHYGAKCHVCGFDFSEVYGEIGKGYIHVHHRKKVSEIGQEYEIDPIKDLYPVCPNCHAMIHRRNPPFTLDEMKELIHNSCRN
jgi:5-methylcytosine-specific restriction protein A